MTTPARPAAPSPSKQKGQNRSKGSAAPRKPRKKTATQRKENKIAPPLSHGIVLISFECLGFSVIGMAAVIVLLGSITDRFSGTKVLNNLLPFAAGIFAFILLVAVLLSGWKRVRRRLQRWSIFLPPVCAVGLAVLIGIFVPREYFTRAFSSYRTLVGGKEEVGRVTLAHQVYAAYRRFDTAQLVKMVNRAGPYSEAIEEAAAVYALDIDLLKGLAATESSFLPRTSGDGGHGLFQITKAPAQVVTGVNRVFPSAEQQMSDPRYNAFLGAATLRHYINEMKGDLFLGLLAYNIGPANGGLRFIMSQYGAIDFITIQPYLLQLPRDYPIRVLSYSLAFRLSRLEGRLLAYEEGKNAMKIQAVGIPGYEK